MIPLTLWNVEEWLDAVRQKRWKFINARDLDGLLAFMKSASDSLMLLIITYPGLSVGSRLANQISILAGRLHYVCPFVTEITDVLNQGLEHCKKQGLPYVSPILEGVRADVLENEIKTCKRKHQDAFGESLRHELLAMRLAPRNMHRFADWGLCD